MQREFMPLTVTGLYEVINYLVKGDFMPTQQDLRAAMQAQKQRILDRTEHSVDATGRVFAPYANRHPFYWYPAKGLKNPAQTIRLVHKRTQGTGQRTKTGIRFASYAAFKASLGAYWPDLRGPKSPHMMDRMRVDARKDEASLTISGEKGEIAGYHMDGTNRMPARPFFGFSDDDSDAIATFLENAIGDRVQREL